MTRSATSSPATLRRIALPVTGVAVGVAALVALGVALAPTITDVLQHVHRESFDDRTTAAAGWVGVPMPSWIPEDARSIRSMATDRETNAIIRVDSRAAEPVGCAPAPRHALPSLTPDWAVPLPTPLPDRVWRCGSYEVIAVHGGFQGWFEATRTGEKPTA